MNKWFGLMILVGFVVIGIIVYSFLRYERPLPKTMDAVDLVKYSGAWYEIALLPNRFEEGCQYTQANYTLKGNVIKVHNSCLKGDAKEKTEIIGKAWPIDNTQSKLKVQFHWPFSGNYWILFVDEKYQYAVVGGPSRKYLWFLAREKTIPDSVFKQLKTIAQEQGFDLTKLIKTVQ